DVEQALLLRRVTTADATVAVVRAGTIPYFAGRSAIDLLGKNDARVARAPATPVASALDFRPGHMKVDFAHSIGENRPDVVVQLRRRTALAAPFLDDAYRSVLLGGQCVQLREASPNVRWERLTLSRCGE